MGLEWNRKVEPLNRNVFPTNLSIGLGSEPFKGRMLEFYWPRALSSTCHAKVTIRPSLHCSQLPLFTLNSITGRLLANLKLLKWPSDSLGPSATTKIDRTPARSLGTYRLRRIFVSGLCFLSTWLPLPALDAGQAKLNTAALKQSKFKY